MSYDLDIALAEHYLNFIHQYPDDVFIWTISYILSENAIKLLKSKRKIKYE